MNKETTQLEDIENWAKEDKNVNATPNDQHSPSTDKNILSDIEAWATNNNSKTF